jgi:3-hydroxyacyl-CoA dehydrogenase
MAGHFRIAAADAILGQPEVNLGIIPGAEGTQRLPRLVGIERALEMCVTGKPLRAADALDAGLVDRVVPDALIEAAVAFAREVRSRGSIVKTRECSAKLGTELENGPRFAAARATAAKARRGQTAPLRAIEAIQAAATLPFDEGRQRERELFFECAADEQAKALIHVFFAERAVAKNKTAVESDDAPLRTVAVIGAGTMGGGIALACAAAGLNVLLKDTTQEALDHGIEKVRHSLDGPVKSGRLTPEAAAKQLARIVPQLSYDRFAEADVIVEAVFEKLELKRQIFAELDAVARPDAILGTNTSTLDIDAIAAATRRPGSVIGLHFFSPARVMRLLEVVVGRDTRPDVTRRAQAFGKRVGKVPVVVANCRGFVGNRMMLPYMYEAQFLVEEGATPAQVDRALTGFGMAMGIFAVDDMAGLDVAWHVRREIGYPWPAGGRNPLVADKLCALLRHGQKTGAGWYAYQADRKPVEDPAVVELIRNTAAEAGIPQQSFTDADIVERCIYALVNEGARIVEDGSAQRASDIDVIYVNGYGFPAWRGGPMFHADRLGIRKIYDRIEQFHRDHGPRWEPAPLLKQLAETGRTFRDLDREKG